MGIRVAAIDCGTNSLRLLLAEAAPDGSLVEIDRRTEIVRLGEGVDASGAFTDQALTRTFAVLDDFASRLTGLDIEPDRVRMVATSAARDVSNRETFLAGVRSRIGIEPEVISGDREAGLSYVGAVSSAAVRAGLGEDPVLVVDIGGGSTELVIGTGEGLVEAAVSLPMGSVRLTERFLRGSSTHGPRRALSWSPPGRTSMACWTTALWTCPRSVARSASPVRSSPWPGWLGWHPPIVTGCPVR